MSDRPEAPRRLPIQIRIMAVGFVALLAWGAFQLWDNARRAPGDGAEAIEFTVDGLDCPFWCAVRLTEAIDELDGAEVADWSQQDGTVVVRHDPARQDLAALTAVFEAAGFPVLATRPR